MHDVVNSICGAPVINLSLAVAAAVKGAVSVGMIGEQYCLNVRQ